MPALRELQLNFVASLFDEADETVNAHVREDGIGASERVDIYRNNLREGFIKALAIGFPVIERLVGTDYFRQLALEFMRAHPSRSGDLHHIGEPFAPFLRARFESTQYACFADVAALEWAYQEALIAEDAVALSAAAFRDIDPTDYERLTFEFHPACHFVRSGFPIVHIWRANQPETQSEEAIDLTSSADNVLVLRTPECVEIHLLPAARFALFETLKRGTNLGTALEAAMTLEPHFDFADALHHLLELQILTGLSLPPPSPPRTHS
jgi:hypothetical protein